MLGVVLVASLSLGSPCWEDAPASWQTTLHPLDTVTRPLGTGYVTVKCFGGDITSSGGLPMWEAKLVGSGGLSLPVTYLFNSTVPYQPQVFNEGTPNTTWSLEFTSYNNFLDTVLDLRFDIQTHASVMPTPQPDYRPYDEEAARIALIYAAVAYVSPVQILEWDLNKSCIAETTGFQVADTYDGSDHYIFTPFAYTGLDTERDLIVVGFKGTNGTSDTVTDLVQIFSGLVYFDYKCQVNQYVSGKTHNGFCVDYQVLQELNILGDVLGLMKANPTYRVLVTGHSLGGALAALFLLDLHSTLVATLPGEAHRLFSYSFGQPRVGDGRFGKLIPHQYRLVHGADVVPHVVFCCADSDNKCYPASRCPYHSAQEVWYPGEMTESAEHKVCDTFTTEDSSCSDSLSYPASVQDHLYYFGRHVGSACYTRPKYEELLREDAKWRSSLSTEDRRRRIARMREELGIPANRTLTHRE